MSKKRKYKTIKIIAEIEERKHIYTAKINGMPSIQRDGWTKKEAIANLESAIFNYLRQMVSRGRG